MVKWEMVLGKLRKVQQTKAQTDLKEGKKYKRKKKLKGNSSKKKKEEQNKMKKKLAQWMKADQMGMAQTLEKRLERREKEVPTTWWLLAQPIPVPLLATSP